MRKIKIILIMIIFLIVLLPTVSNAASISVGQAKNLKVSSQTTNTITLNWKKVSKATGYRVYKYNSSKKKYEYYAQITKNSIVIKKLTTATEYKFKVKAYRILKGKKYYGKFSTALKTATKPEDVKNLKSVSQTDSTIKLEWSKVKRATGYSVYVYNENTKSYNIYANTTVNAICLRNLYSSKEYKIKVRAYKSVNNQKIYGAYSSQINVVTNPSKVSGLKANNNTFNEINISWDKVERVDGYCVYKYSDEKMEWEQIDQINNVSINITGLKEASEYKFKVMAYSIINSKNYYGDYSDILQTVTIPQDTIKLKKVEQTENSLTVEWDQIDNASGYNVYVASSNIYSLYKTTTENSIIIKDIDITKQYKVYVKPFVTINGIKYYYNQSNIIKSDVVSTDNVKFGIDVSQHQGEIDWNALDGHVNFAILRLGWIGNKNNHTLDKYFIQNYKECKRLGIPVGVYVYNYCNSDDTIKQGAEWTIKNLMDNGVELELPVYIDMEDSSISGLGKNVLTNMCIEFNTIIENAKYKAGVYACKNWFDNYLDQSLKTKYSCWIAHYTNSKLDYSKEYDIWQYTSTATITGITGNVDMNVMYVK